MTEPKGFGGTLAFTRAFLLTAVAFALAPAGVPLIRAQDTAVAAAETEAGRVVFAGYNLMNYLRMDRRLQGELVADAPKPETEIAAVISMLTRIRPDILGLTEIGQREDLADLQGRLMKIGIELPHATLCESFDEERRLALLSRFPIVETHHQTDLTYTLDAKRLAFRRGILDATVQVNEHYRLRCVGTHLKSKRDIEKADQAAMRRHEAHLLRLHINRILLTGPGTNLLVFGDFNDTRNERPIKAIQGGFGTEGYLKDLQLQDSQGYRWTYYWHYADQYSRFDFIFVNKALLPEVLMGKGYIGSGPEWHTASDHRPVVALIAPRNQ